MGIEKDPLADEIAQEEMALTREVLEKLSQPFPEEAIEWKPQKLYPKDKPTKALAVPYITARHVMDRLDEVVAPAGWSSDFDSIPGLKAVKMMLTVLGVTKCDIGFVEGDDDRAIKGSVSDGLKRAAVLFGIGRYLYDAEVQWVKWDDQHRQFAEEPQLKFKNDPGPPTAKKAKKAKKQDPLVEAALEMGAEISEPPEKVTVGLIEQEANAQLEAMGLEPHYKGRVHTIKAMEACGYKGTAQKYLADNFSDIVACLIDRVKEKEEAE